MSRSPSAETRDDGVGRRPDRSPPLDKEALRNRSRRLANALGWAAALAGVALMLAAATVMIAWHAHITPLLQLRPTWSLMQYNTALGIGLLGAGLLALARAHWTPASALGLAVSLLGGLTIIEYSAGIDLRIDQLLCRAYLAVDTEHPGRMAPNTAVAFVIAGGILVLLAGTARRRRSSLAPALLTSVVFGLAVSALFGYAAYVPETHAWGQLTGMAAHTAASLALFALGGFALNWRRELRHTGLTPRWLPAPVAICSTVLAVSLWYGLMVEHRSHTQELLAADVKDTTRLLEERLWKPLNAASNVGRRWAETSGGDAWLRPALADNIDDEPALLQVARLDLGGNTLWVIPARGRQELPAAVYRSAADAVLGRPDASQSALVGPSFALQGGRVGILALAPLIRDGRAEGTIMVIYDLHELLTSASQSLEAMGLNGVLLRAGKWTYSIGSRDAALVNERAVSAPLRAPGEWAVRLTPTPARLQREQSVIPSVTLVSGLLVTLLLSLTVHLTLESWARSRQLWSANLRLQAEVTERQSVQHRFQRVFEAAPYAMLMVDSSGVIQLANQEAERLFGYDRSELIGQPVELLIPEGQRAGHISHRLSYVQSPCPRKMSASLPIFARRRDASEVPVEIALAPLDQAEGPMVIASIIDITDRKRAEDDLRRAHEELEERVEQRTLALRSAMDELASSNQELDEFAYIASHDLKEPLRGIHNYSTFLLEDYAEKLDDDGRHKLETLTKLTQNMERLIDDLLRYSRVGRLDLAVEDTDLNHVLDEVVSSVQVTLEQQGIEVRVPAPLPTLCCDRARIGEVFRNLITNAIKYNDKPEKWIEVGCVANGDRPAAAPDDDHARLFYVRDNGIGIREKHREAIFRIFKRLHGRDKYGGGTGAGLTIAQKIVQRHGGRIWVESDEGDGSTFYFTLNEGERADGVTGGGHWPTDFDG